MTNKEQASAAPCDVCGASVLRAGMVLGATMKPAVLQLIQDAHPGFSSGSRACGKCHANYRATYVRALLTGERGELTGLEEQVLEALHREETLATDSNQQFQDAMTLGQRVADRVAAFGGSWAFIGLFGGIILIWMVTNAGVWLSKPFDPYPFILLNLVLSSLAALQAPVIMMSQNRQSMKDRLQADNDYRVNLKAELEVRLLHGKLERLMTHQWQRLLEIQEAQLELLGQERSGGEGLSPTEPPA